MARYQTTVCKKGVCKAHRTRNSLAQAEKDMRAWMQKEARKLRLRQKGMEEEIRAYVTEIGSDDPIQEGEIRIGAPKKKGGRRRPPADSE